MANVMNQKNVKNHASRGSFDLSRRVCFTSSCGELLPVAWLPVLPGDKFKINIKPFTRTQPLQTATFARIREYYDVFFVPYSLLWDKFNSWIIQTDNPQHALSSTSTIVLNESHPYFNSGDLANFLTTANDNKTSLTDDVGRPVVYSSRKLMDYLGYTDVIRTSTTPVRLNPFPALAYQKIYQDYFRNPLWERSAPWTYNLDYILSNSETKVDFPYTNPQQMASYNRTIWTLQYCNFDKDIFFGRYPNAQFGDESSVDLYMDTSNSDRAFEFVAPNVNSTTAGVDARISAANSGSYGKNELVNSGNAPLSTKLRTPRYIDAKEESVIPISQLSILQLRKAQQIQKLREITQTGSLDYRDQISKIWNESSPLALSYRCQYIGGSQSDINVSEVINQALDNSNSSATIKGVGRSAADGTIRFYNKTNEYGILMVIKHEKPLIDWTNDSYVDKNIMATTADMYPNPMFDRIGNEAIYNYEFFPSPEDGHDALTLPQAIGYAPRYYNYKTAVDRALGGFDLPTFSPWVIPFDLSKLLVPNAGQQPGSKGLDNYMYFKVSPSVIANIFTVQPPTSGIPDFNAYLSYDQFLNACYLNIHAIRKLDRDGLPY